MPYSQGSGRNALSYSDSPAGDAYMALVPRGLTTSAGRIVKAHAAVNLTVAGLDSVPKGAKAVALEVTATDTSASGYLSVYPAGTSKPAVSSLDWTKGETLTNLVIVPVGSNDQVSLYDYTGSADIVVDLEGYFAPEPSGDTSGSYVPLKPAGIADTRPGSGYPRAGATLHAGETLQVQVTGAGGVPSAGVACALLDLTVTDTTAASHLTVWPTGQARLPVSDLTWVKGDTVANQVIVPVGSTGRILLYNSAGDADVAVDVDGYFTKDGLAPKDASLFTPITPVRVLDSGWAIGPGQTITQQIAGTGGISPTATAAVTDVTAIDTTAASYFTVYPGGTRPAAPDVRWSASEIVSNLTVMALSASGAISIHNDAGHAVVVVAAFGYFDPTSQPAASPLSVTTTSPPSGTEGTAYSATLGASGGTAPYSWNLTSGALPAGLSLSAGGAITGTPSTAGTSDFTVQVTDSTTPTAQEASASLAITVAAGASTTPTVSPPSSIASNCSIDVTGALNAFFASLPKGANVALPSGACYLVSNYDLYTSAPLTLSGTSGVTVAGDGATLKQSFFSCGVYPGPGGVWPILNVVGNTDLTVENLTIEGPASCSGKYNEGDYGLMLVGNTTATFNGVTVENTDGDGLAVYPDQGTNTAINTDITFENGVLSNIAYHGVTIEGVNGFDFTGNSVTQVGSFMDLEVDASCSPNCFDSSGNPVGAAQWNVTVQNNTFTDGTGGLWIESEQSACVPQKNLTIEDNTLDATVSPDITLMGSWSSACPFDSGLTISGNVGTNPASPGSGPEWTIQDYANVLINNNTFLAFDGLSTYYANTPLFIWAGLCSVNGASVQNNVFNNAIAPLETTGCWNWAAGAPPSTGVSECGNTYWLTEPILGVAADPKTDAACEGSAQVDALP